VISADVGQVAETVLDPDELQPARSNTNKIKYLAMTKSTLPFGPFYSGAAATSGSG
jgi:hypothetical protein